MATRAGYALSVPLTAAGTYTVQSPCRDCPEDNKTQAHYPDEDGNLNRLCAGCAKAAGYVARSAISVQGQP